MVIQHGFPEIMHHDENASSLQNRPDVICHFFLEAFSKAVALFLCLRQHRISFFPALSE
jgi:hypothetical protein